MTEASISAVLRRAVWARARDTCEYCLLPSSVAFFPHEVEHIVARKHGGMTDETNLALACWRCNRHKGTDLGSFDPRTGAFSFLYHPRVQRWADHFMLVGVEIVGRTAAGRTTVRLLQINTPERAGERERLLAAGHQFGEPTGREPS